MLWYEEALDNLHLHIVLQLLKGGADVKAVAAQVRPAALLCISALLPSGHNNQRLCNRGHPAAHAPRAHAYQNLHWRVEALH